MKKCPKWLCFLTGVLFCELWSNSRRVGEPVSLEILEVLLGISVHRPMTVDYDKFDVE